MLITLDEISGDAEKRAGHRENISWGQSLRQAGGQKLLPPPSRPESDAARESRIASNPAAATAGDVKFLLSEVEHLRCDVIRASFQRGSNCAPRSSIDVEAWIASRRAPGGDWIKALAGPFVPVA